MELKECDLIVRRLEACRRALVLTHARPDGDAIGCGVALCTVLARLGKSAEFALLTAWPSRYEFLVERCQVRRLWQTPVQLADYDLVVVVDTCAYSQLDNLQPQLDACRDRVVVIDHHHTRDPIGSVQWVDETAPACGSMVHRLIVRAGWPIDSKLAEALFVALATDTGWFRFSNTTPDALRSAADLAELGLDMAGLYQRVYQNESPQRLALGCSMLSHMELRAGGRLAILKITREMYAASGVSPADTEGLIDLPQSIGSVVLTVLMVERPDDGGVRLSFRSKSAVDVNVLARQFGGGGHPRASGAKVAGESLDSLRGRVIAACEQALADAGL